MGTVIADPACLVDGATMRRNENLGQKHAFFYGRFRGLALLTLLFSRTLLRMIQKI